MTYIYARISTDQQSEASLENQETTCRKWVSEPITVVQEIESGAKEDRPKLNQMIDMLQTGDRVCVYDYSRLSRKTKNALDILDQITEKGAVLISGGKTIDPEDPIDMFTYSIHSSMAEMQRNIQAKKAREGIRQVYESGDYVFCSTLFGYDLVRHGKNKIVTVIEEEAKIIQFIFEKFSSGWSVKKILSQVSGLPLQRQPNFTLKKISRILHQPIYMGYYINNKEKPEDLSRCTRNVLEGLLIHSNVYPPIISEDLFWDCFEKYREVTPTHARPWQLRWTKHTLSGILRCPSCGKGLAHFMKMGEVYCTEDHSPTCQTKYRTKFQGDWLEKIMALSFYMTFMQGDEIGAFFSDKQQELFQDKSAITETLKGVEHELSEVKTKISRIVSAIADGIITNEEAGKQMNSLKQTVNELEERKSNLKQDLLMIEEDIDSYLELSCEQVIEEFPTKERDFYKKFLKYGYAYKDRIEIEYMNGKHYTIPRGYRHNHTTDSVTVTSTFNDDSYQFEYTTDSVRLVKSQTEVYDDYIEEILDRAWRLVNGNT